MKVVWNLKKFIVTILKDVCISYYVFDQETFPTWRLKGIGSGAKTRRNRVIPGQEPVTLEHRPPWATLFKLGHLSPLFHSPPQLSLSLPLCRPPSPFIRITVLPPFVLARRPVRSLCFFFPSQSAGFSDMNSQENQYICRWLTLSIYHWLFT